VIYVITNYGCSLQVPGNGDRKCPVAYWSNNGRYPRSCRPWKKSFPKTWLTSWMMKRKDSTFKDWNGTTPHQSYLIP